MNRRLFVLATTLLAAACSGGSSPMPSSPVVLPPHAGSPSSPIQHVILIVQENRSFDNFFNCFAGTDCVKTGKEKVKKGGKYVDKKITLQEQDLLPPKSVRTDIGHCYYSFVTAYDGGKMDGFNLEPKGVCPRKFGEKVQGIGAFAYQYVKESDIAPYWDMAKQYVLADRMFQTQGSGSFTAHQDLIRGGTALAGAYGSSASMIDTPDGEPWGCDAPSDVVTNLITIGLKWHENTGPYPCTKDFPSSGSSYTTLADLLDSAGVSWKYYTPCFVVTDDCNASQKCTSCDGALLNAFDVIATVRNGPEWGTNVSMPQTNIFTDIENGQLPSVAWVIPSDQDSDHPGSSSDDGPAWVASVVNAVGESQFWSTSAIVVLWDDWGGMYDHVSPSFLRDNQGGLGFRIPMIVISPYAPKGSVSHTQYEFGSLLKYVEQNWSLGSLKTTDARANSIVNVFDYNQKPRKFTTIPSSRSIRHFMDEPPSSAGDPE
ncbi:MAG: alkaline phosphatase family protein [Candidatus Cybelea sp.]|jgi:phospholipase C